MSHLTYSILAIIDLSGNTVWPQAQVFQKLAKLTSFGTFNEFLSKINETFFDSQTPCLLVDVKITLASLNEWILRTPFQIELKGVR